MGHPLTHPSISSSSRETSLGSMAANNVLVACYHIKLLIIDSRPLAEEAAPRAARLRLSPMN